MIHLLLGVVDRGLTRKGGCHKDRGKTTNAADKWGVGEMPVLTSDVATLLVSSTVDDDAHDDEDLNTY